MTTLKTAARETNGCGKGKNLTRFQVPREGLFDMVAQEPGRYFRPTLVLGILGGGGGGYVFQTRIGKGGIIFTSKFFFWGGSVLKHYTF